MTGKLGKTVARNPLSIFDYAEINVHRARRDGSYYVDENERQIVEDLITNNGRVFLAQRIGLDVNSPMAHMAVGTMTTAAALTDAIVSGEVARNALAVNSALTNNEYTATTTFAGDADSVTSVALTEAGLVNHATSGEGTLFQRVVFAAVTLAASDFLNITLKTNVGSNTI